MQTIEPSGAAAGPSQRRRIAITVTLLALLALGFFISAFFKPWQ